MEQAQDNLDQSPLIVLAAAHAVAGPVSHALHMPNNHTNQSSSDCQVRTDPSGLTCLYIQSTVVIWLGN
jgi:hypothetical protein